MKKLTLIISLLFTCLFLNAQTVVKDKDGNYIQVKSVDTTASYTATGKTFTDSKSNVYPVFISKNGKLFVIRVSKNTGKEYRYYLTGKL